MQICVRPGFRSFRACLLPERGRLSRQEARQLPASPAVPPPGRTPAASSVCRRALPFPVWKPVISRLSLVTWSFCVDVAPRLSDPRTPPCTPVFCIWTRPASFLRETQLSRARRLPPCMERDPGPSEPLLGAGVARTGGDGRRRGDLPQWCRAGANGRPVWVCLTGCRNFSSNKKDVFSSEENSVVR